MATRKNPPGLRVPAARAQSTATAASDAATAGGTPGPATQPPSHAAMLRSRGYIMLLVVAAILGVPISAAAYGFLALVSYLQKELFLHLPHGLGYANVPAWWPLPILLVGGVLAGLAIRYLPGDGG